jgi:MFS family permease
MDDTADYRPVSPLAVASLVVSMVAALAVITPFAWAIPLVGAGLAVAALADIGRPGAAKAGRLVALAALALSVGFGAQAVVGHMVDRWIVGRRAAAAAEVWIDAVREGRPADAMAVSAPTVLAGLSDGHAAEHGEVVDPAARAAAFAALPAVRAVAACGTVRPAIETDGPTGRDVDWSVRATLTGCGGAEATLRFVATPRLVRTPAGPVERWTIASFELVP